MAECPGIWQLAETKDGGLARLRLPGGSLAASQMLAIAAIAESFGNGLIDLTHRANLQIRGLDLRARDSVAAALTDRGMMADVAEADRLRNILASPLAGLDPQEIVDVGLVVGAIDTGLQADPALHGLSPKFSFVVDGGGPFGVSALGHDIGLLAERSPDGTHFRVSLAGSRTRFIVPPPRAGDAAIALAAVAAEASARMAELMTDHSAENIVDRAARYGQLVFREADPAPETPSQAGSPIGVVPQIEPGYCAYGLGIPLARLGRESGERLARLAERYGDGSLRLSPWQVIFVPGVRETSLDDFCDEARDGGFQIDPADNHIRVIACAGATGCLRTRADTKRDGRSLLTALEAFPTAGKNDRIVHFCGCDRSCAHPGTADLLLLAEAETDCYDIFADAAPRNVEQAAALAEGLSAPEAVAFVSRFLRDTS